MTAAAAIARPGAQAAPLAIAAQGVRKRFGAVEVLKGIDLEAREGDVIAMIGASGSGKSTFLRCLNLLERPTAGRIAIGGEELALKPDGRGDLTAADPAQLRRCRARLAMVFQQFNLWSHMTARQNVMEAPMKVLGLTRAEAGERADAYLAKVGVGHRAHAYPAFLSGGEQQRVAIARALAMEPMALLFDEPTSALDPELVGEVLRAMRGLAEEGRTMIVVTHEIGFARDVSNRVVFLNQGLIEEEGPPAAVLGAPRSERLRAFLARALG
jgi:arginine/ornithine transport system ATP-binding protein